MPTAEVLLHRRETKIVRLILQRVASASVTVGDERIAHIGHGVLVLLGIETGDDEVRARAAAEKLSTLRMFADPAADTGHMNLDARAVGAEFLVVSQFTLAANLSRGRRPSFDRAAPPDVAGPLVDLFARQLAQKGFRVATGRFGAQMRVELVNDGPVTFVLDLSPSATAASGRE